MYILILSIIAVCGAVAVSLGKPLTANCLWILTNPLMAIYNYQNYEFEMAGMFATYSVIAVYGIWNLKTKREVRK
ncbi:MAG: hypothetical protein KAS32_20315 [Candidatus Peribacteraceae bacterium]|nr:hypothetical protein [Candidatus Peribacteraceae bacterium]